MKRFLMFLPHAFPPEDVSSNVPYGRMAEEVSAGLGRSCQVLVRLCQCEHRIGNQNARHFSNQIHLTPIFTALDGLPDVHFLREKQMRTDAVL